MIDSKGKWNGGDRDEVDCGIGMTVGCGRKSEPNSDSGSTRDEVVEK
jgi:hypothetical protein